MVDLNFKKILSLNYILEEAGWANIEISNGEEIININISYLHDSLKNLAESAINLKIKNEQSVIFMDEPGEHWLILKKVENLIEYELRWYEDWTSWNLISEEKYQTKLSGTTTFPIYIKEVRKILINIFNEFGVEKYKEKWIEHDFPLTEFEKLK